MNKITAMFLLLASSEALSDQCWSTYLEDMAENQGVEPVVMATKQAYLVFVGEAETTMKTVLSTKDSEDSLIKSSSVFNVQEVLKGPKLKKVRIDSPESACTCKYDFKPGVSYIVLASKSNDDYHVMGCKYIRQNGHAYKEFFLDIIKEIDNAKN